MSTRQFRIIPLGSRRVGPHLAPSGVRLEELLHERYSRWTYVDQLPDDASAESYIRSCGGELVHVAN